MRFIKANIFLYFFLLILGISGFIFAIIWPEIKGFYAFISFLSLAGFCVAGYIYYTKKYGKELVCPIGSDCNVVINSKYAKFLNISLEYWGMSYYFIILISYIILTFTPHLLSPFSVFGLIMLSFSAFLFSLYLLFVQAFLLRAWCIWCLLSALFSTIIFIISLSGINIAINFLNEINIIIELIQGIGFIFGLGGATISLFLFSKFLQDLHIDEKELDIIKIISELIWLGLTFVIVSQFASFVMSKENLSQSGPFLAQTISLFMIIINGTLLMIIFAPYLAFISFNEKEKNHTHSPVESLRKPFFLIGSITISSWYFAFILNYVKDYKFINLIFIYIAILIISIIMALFWERKITSKIL